MCVLRAYVSGVVRTRRRKKRATRTEEITHAFIVRVRARVCVLCVCVRGMIVMWRSPGSLIELGDLVAARGETTLIPRWFHPQRINER